MLKKWMWMWMVTGAVTHISFVNIVQAGDASASNCLQLPKVINAIKAASGIPGFRGYSSDFKIRGKPSKGYIVLVLSKLFEFEDQRFEKEKIYWRIGSAVDQVGCSDVQIGKPITAYERGKWAIVESTEKSLGLAPTKKYFDGVASTQFSSEELAEQSPKLRVYFEGDEKNGRVTIHEIDDDFFLYVCAVGETQAIEHTFVIEWGDYAKGEVKVDPEFSRLQKKALVNAMDEIAGRGFCKAKPASLPGLRESDINEPKDEGGSASGGAVKDSAAPVGRGSSAKIRM